MMTELRDSIEYFESDSNVKAVVIRNDGKVFSSGHDLKELQTLQKVSGTTEAVFQICSQLMLKVLCNVSAVAHSFGLFPISKTTSRIIFL